MWVCDMYARVVFWDLVSPPRPPSDVCRYRFLPECVQMSHLRLDFGRKHVPSFSYKSICTGNMKHSD